MLPRLLDFEEPLERLDTDELTRADDELLDPELDLDILGALLELRLTEDLDRVTDELFGLDLDLFILEVFVERVSPEDIFRVLEERYPDLVLLADEVRLL